MAGLDRRSPLTLCGASGAALFIILFLPWYGVDFGSIGGGLSESLVKASGVDTTASGWQAFSYTDLWLLLTSLTAVAALVLGTQGHEHAGLAVKAAAGLGAWCTLLVMYRIINQPGDNSLITVKYGAFLGLIAVAGVTIGAVRAMGSEQTSPSAAAPTV